MNSTIFAFSFILAANNPCLVLKDCKMIFKCISSSILMFLLCIFLLYSKNLKHICYVMQRTLLTLSFLNLVFYYCLWHFLVIFSSVTNFYLFHFTASYAYLSDWNKLCTLVQNFQNFRNFFDFFELVLRRMCRKSGPGIRSDVLFD